MVARLILLPALRTFLKISSSLSVSLVPRASATSSDAWVQMGGGGGHFGEAARRARRARQVGWRPEPRTNPASPSQPLPRTRLTTVCTSSPFTAVDRISRSINLIDCSRGAVP